MFCCRRPPSERFLKSHHNPDYVDQFVCVRDIVRCDTTVILGDNEATLFPMMGSHAGDLWYL